MTQTIASPVGVIGWQSGKARCTKNLRFPAQGTPISVAFSLDAQLLAVASSRTIVLWNLANERQTQTFRCPDTITKVRFPDAGSVAGLVDGYHYSSHYNVFDIRSGKLIDSRMSLYLPDPYASEGDDQLVVWHNNLTSVMVGTDRQNAMATMYHPGGVVDAAISKSGRLIASIAKDGSVRVWEPES